VKVIIPEAPQADSYWYRAGREYVDDMLELHAYASYGEAGLEECDDDGVGLGPDHCAVVCLKVYDDYYAQSEFDNAIVAAATVSLPELIAAFEHRGKKNFSIPCSVNEVRVEGCGPDRALLYVDCIGDDEYGPGDSAWPGRLVRGGIEIDRVAAATTFRSLHEWRLRGREVLKGAEELSPVSPSISVAAISPVSSEEELNDYEAVDLNSRRRGLEIAKKALALVEQHLPQGCTVRLDSGESVIGDYDDQQPYALAFLGKEGSLIERIHLVILPDAVNGEDVTIRQAREDESQMWAIAGPIIKSGARDISERQKAGWLAWEEGELALCGRRMLLAYRKEIPTSTVDSDNRAFIGRNRDVVRTLLIDPERIWKQKDLAEESQTSRVIVSRVLQLLAAAGYVNHNHGSGRWLLNAPGLQVAYEAAAGLLPPV
jgi:hypothetical protein